MIQMHLPYFPPSTNKAFFSRHGRLHLSDEGKAFKENVKAHIIQNYARQIRDFKKNVPYLLYLRVIFAEGLENAGWPKKCQTRYKKMDATNRIKLVEDAVRDALGVDDSQFLGVVVEKTGPKFGDQDPKSHLIVFLWDLENERSPLDDFQRL